jgi:hypothetical protein
MDKAVADMRATSTLGAFLRAFTWGNVRQLEKTERRLIHRSTTRILFSSGTRCSRPAISPWTWVTGLSTLRFLIHDRDPIFTAGFGRCSMLGDRDHHHPAERRRG